MVTQPILDSHCPIPMSDSFPLDAGKSCKPSVDLRAPENEEWEIVQCALAGDREALATLFARHNQKLYHIAFRLLRNKQDAEDALQESWLCAYRNLGSFQGRSTFSTWLVRIIINAARQRLRKQRTHPSVSLDDPLRDHQWQAARGPFDEFPNPERTYAHAETRQLLTQHLSLLAPRLRSAIQLRYVQNLSTWEASKAAGITVPALKSRLRRARLKLANSLAPVMKSPRASAPCLLSTVKPVSTYRMAFRTNRKEQ